MKAFPHWGWVSINGLWIRGGFSCLQRDDTREDDLRLSRTRGAGDIACIARLEIVAGVRLRISTSLVATKFQSLKMEATLVWLTVKDGREPIFSIMTFSCWNSTSMPVSFIITSISSRMTLRLLIIFES